MFEIKECGELSKWRYGYLGIDGTVKYNKEILALRNNSKMSKDICMICRIAPICGGGCKQRAMEALDDKECIFHYTDIDKDNIILPVGGINLS